MTFSEFALHFHVLVVMSIESECNYGCSSMVLLVRRII